VSTRLEPRSLKQSVLRDIEDRLGRVRGSDKYAPRPIDLDLLLYRDCVNDEADLKIPDPEILLRPFLYEGLLELNPDIVLPSTGRPLREMVADRPPMPLEEADSYTSLLRTSLLL